MPQPQSSNAEDANVAIRPILPPGAVGTLFVEFCPEHAGLDTPLARLARVPDVDLVRNVHATLECLDCDVRGCAGSTGLQAIAVVCENVRFLAVLDDRFCQLTAVPNYFGLCAFVQLTELRWSRDPCTPWMKSAVSLLGLLTITPNLRILEVTRHGSGWGAIDTVDDLRIPTYSCSVRLTRLIWGVHEELEVIYSVLLSSSASLVELDVRVEHGFGFTGRLAQGFPALPHLQTFTSASRSILHTAEVLRKMPRVKRIIIGLAAYEDIGPILTEINNAALCIRVLELRRAEGWNQWEISALRKHLNGNLHGLGVYGECIFSSPLGGKHVIQSHTAV